MSYCSNIPSHKTSGNAQLLHLSRRTWKLSFFRSTSVPVNFSSHFSYQKLSLCVCMCVCVCVCECVCMYVWKYQWFAAGNISRGQWDTRRTEWSSASVTLVPRSLSSLIVALFVCFLFFLSFFFSFFFPDFNQSRKYIILARKRRFVPLYTTACSGAGFVSSVNRLINR